MSLFVIKYKHISFKKVEYEWHNDVLIQKMISWFNLLVAENIMQHQINVTILKLASSFPMPSALHKFL